MLGAKLFIWYDVSKANDSCEDWQSVPSKQIQPQLKDMHIETENITCANYKIQV